MFTTFKLAALAATVTLATGMLHNHLVKSSPGKDEQLTSAPKEVRLWFSERPEVAFTTGGAKVLVERVHAEAAAQLLRVEEPPELAAQRAVLTARFRGCMLPAVLGALLFVVGAFVGNYVASWLGAFLFAIATVLVVLACVRGARAA